MTPAENQKRLATIRPDAFDVKVLALRGRTFQENKIPLSIFQGGESFSFSHLLKTDRGSIAVFASPDRMRVLGAKVEVSV